MPSTINTAPLESLWLPHTDDIAVVITAHMQHIDDASHWLTVEFSADDTGWCWTGTDTALPDWVCTPHGTTLAIAQAVIDEMDPEQRPLVAGRSLLAAGAALDALALAWDRCNPVASVTGGRPTGLRMLPLDSTNMLWLLSTQSGVAHTAVMDSQTGALRVDINPTRTLAASLNRARGREIPVAQALTGDGAAASEHVAAAGWLSPGHAALAFLHRRCPLPLRYRALLSSDPISARILGEGILALLGA